MSQVYEVFRGSVGSAQLETQLTQELRLRV